MITLTEYLAIYDADDSEAALVEITGAASQEAAYIELMRTPRQIERRDGTEILLDNPLRGMESIIVPHKRPFYCYLPTIVSGMSRGLHIVGEIANLPASQMVQMSFTDFVGVASLVVPTHMSAFAPDEKSVVRLVGRQIEALGDNDEIVSAILLLRKFGFSLSEYSEFDIDRVYGLMYAFINYHEAREIDETDEELGAMISQIRSGGAL